MHGFTAQLLVISGEMALWLRYLQVTCGKHVITFSVIIVHLLLPQYCLQHSSVLFCTWVVNSCVVATNATSCLYSVFPWRTYSHSRSLNLGINLTLYYCRLFTGSLFQAMDTIFGPYFHFRLEPALETWAKTALTPGFMTLTTPTLSH